ncbi:MAG: ABC transporter substrate-binding protein [Christensenellales bacterium]|jgi:raffinose/stachyose/melibiose transport system substrate-binding protein
MKRTLSVLLALLMVVTLFAGTVAAEEKFQSRKIKMLSIWDDTDPSTNGYIIAELSKQYAETVEGFELDYEFVSIDQLDTKVSTYLQGELPDVLVYESGVRLKKVIESGKILDIDKAFTEMGIRDVLDDGAVSLLTNLVDGIGLYDLPLGLNVEGFWYNKALFEQAGIEKAPETWDEFMVVCQKLVDAGIEPIVQGGKDKWPMTRVLNAYLVRSVGLNAVKDAVEGKAKFTDPEYVAAAQMFADMAQKGYFVEGMTTIDPATASAMLESGDAAIKYDGSWYTDRLNQPDNMAGPEGIGFFNVPVVTGVEAGGTLDDYSMNCGNILMVSADAYDEQLQHWMKFVFTRIGDFAMQNNGSFKGYKINEYPEMTAYTQIVADALRTAKGSFLWFEAKMDSESSQIAQNNIAMLYSGEMTAEEYMNQLQESIERNR